MAKPIFKEYSTDQSIENSGTWVSFGTNADGTVEKILLARAGGANAKYFTEMAKAGDTHKQGIKTGAIDGLEGKKILMQVYANSVVLNWENIYDRNGNIYPYSKENCLNMFYKMHDFFDVISEICSEREAFRDAQLEDDIKN